MNKLAHLVHRLIDGNETDHVDLSKFEGPVVRKLRFILNRDLDELAVQLSQPHVQAEEWLVLPQPTSDD